MEQELNQVLTELTKIEQAAAGMNDTLTSDKARLVARYDQMKKELQQKLQAEGEAEIESVKAKLSKDHDAQIAELKAKTAAAIESMEADFEAHHSEWAEEVFNLVINEG
ncbi:MAG: hypothetical protein HUJ75_06475 [Parasporobacterium sp.]|nr:hypothetical protein [Parasporobacterium sp.]